MVIGKVKQIYCNIKTNLTLSNIECVKEINYSNVKYEIRILNFREKNILIIPIQLFLELGGLI